MTDRLRVGVITSTHGIRGEVKVFPTTDDPARYKKLKQVYLVTRKETLPLTIQSVKFFKQFVIVKFREYNDINEVEQYKNAELWIDRKDAMPLEEGEYYIADLIGLTVMTDEVEKLGVMKDVLQTGANDVYEVEMENGKTVLLPYIEECVKKVDLEKGEILVHVMDGLLDL